MDSIAHTTYRLEASDVKDNDIKLPFRDIKSTLAINHSTAQLRIGVANGSSQQTQRSPNDQQSCGPMGNIPRFLETNASDLSNLAAIVTPTCELSPTLQFKDSLSQVSAKNRN